MTQWLVKGSEVLNVNGSVLTKPTPVEPITHPLEWIKLDNTIQGVHDPGTPATNGRLGLGSSGKGDDFRAYSPNVYKDGSVYRLTYIGAADSSNFFMYSASADNGLDWDKLNNTQYSTSFDSDVVPPALDPPPGDGRNYRGTGGTGDDQYAQNGVMIKEGSTYKLWYIGSDGTAGGGGRIFMATSTDAKTWYKVNNATPAAHDSGGSAPGGGRIGLGSSGKEDDFSINYLTMVAESPSLYKIWYAAKDTSGSTTWRIFMATSTDGGYTWDKVENDPIPGIGPYHDSDGPSSTPPGNGLILLGSPGRGDDVNINGVSVIYDQGIHKMLYRGYDGASNYFFYAYSTDGGYNWIKYNNNTPTFSTRDSGASGSNGWLVKGSGGKSDSSTISDPAMIKDGDTYKLWYTAWPGTNAQTSYATSLGTEITGV